MDRLPWTSWVLSYVGLKENENRVHQRNFISKLHYYRRLFMKIYVRLYFLWGSLYTCYLFHRMQRVDNFVFGFLIFFCYSSAVIVFQTMSLNTGVVMKQLEKRLKKLTERYSDDLRRKDRSLVICHYLITAMPFLVLTIYVFANMNNIDWRFADFYSSKTETLLHLTGFGTSIFSNIFVSLIYQIIIESCNVYGQEIRDKIRVIVKQRSSLHFNCKHALNSLDYDTILTSLQDFHKLINVINDRLGLIPLSLFALLFIEVVLGICFIVLSKSEGMSFIFIGLGSAILLHTIAVVVITRTASRTAKTMREAVGFARRLSLVKLPHKTGFEAFESRRCLTVFLDQEPVVVSFTCMSMFTLEPSVILSFFNALVPFTVMFITTVYQIMDTSSCKATSSRKHNETNR